MRTNKIHNADLFTSSANETFKKHIKTQSKAALEIINSTIDWDKLVLPIETKINKATTGRPRFSMLTIIKCFILQSIYSLSDPRLEEEIADRRSFQIFLDIQSGDSIPDETTICRYRELFAKFNLDIKLFKSFYKQLKKKGLVLEQGTLVDATIRESYTKPKGNNNVGNRDTGADFAKRNGGKTVYGYKGHIGMDMKSKIIHSVEFTPVSTHETKMLENMLHNKEQIVIADKGFARRERKQLFRENGPVYGILDKAYPSNPLTRKQIKRNKALSRIRNDVEKPFAFMKNILNYTKCKYYSLNRNRFQFVLSSMIYNMRRMISLRPKLT